MMSHTGGKEGTYPGTRASATMIGDDETNWGTKSLAILDMPFTAVMDTLLLPWDVFRKDSSVRSRVEKAKPTRKPPMRLFHRPECLITDLAISFGDPQGRLPSTPATDHPARRPRRPQKVDWRGFRLNTQPRRFAHGHKQFDYPAQSPTILLTDAS